MKPRFCEQGCGGEVISVWKVCSVAHSKPGPLYRRDKAKALRSCLVLSCYQLTLAPALSPAVTVSQWCLVQGVQGVQGLQFPDVASLDKWLPGLPELPSLLGGSLGARSFPGGVNRGPLNLGLETI